MFSLIITEDQANQRIDKIFSAQFPDFSRTQWQRDGVFEREGVVASYKIKAKEGETWTGKVEASFDPKTLLQPWDCPLGILEEADDWLVIEKPIGVSVHPSASEKTHHTIVNALLHHYGKANLPDHYDEQDGLQIPKLGLVHRLDKGTSGVLLIAKTDKALRFFQSHWKEVEKIYYAKVQGTPPPKGNIEGAILRDPREPQRMSISGSPKAKDARTSFELVETVDNISLLRITLHTGRTHQIRVHLSSIGYPIIGDELYGGPEADRIMLHAASLKFPVERGGEEEVKSEVPF